MAIRAGEIVINIRAGTAAFLPELEQIKGGIRSVGKEAEGTFNKRYAMFGLKDIAEGRYTFAAAELVNMLTRLQGAMLGVGLAGVGIGLLAFAFLELGNKIQQARDKATEAFRSMNEPLQKTNDELDLSSAKLDNEFARLSHKPVNRLAEALAEGRVEADNLADSLDKDLEKLKKVMDESRSGIWMKFMNKIGQDDTANAAINLTREINEIMTRGEIGIRNATTPEGQAEARIARDKEANDKYEAYAKDARKRRQDAIDAAKEHMITVHSKTEGDTQVEVPAGVPNRDIVDRETAFLQQMALQRSFIGKKEEDDGKRLRNEGMGDQKREAEEQLKQWQKEFDALKRDHEVTLTEERSFWESKIQLTHGGAGAWEDTFLSVANRVGNLNQQVLKQRHEANQHDVMLQEQDFADQLKEVQRHAELEGKDPATAGLNFVQGARESTSMSEGALKKSNEVLLELTKASDAAITTEVKNSLREQDLAWEESTHRSGEEIVAHAEAIRASLEGFRGMFLGVDELLDAQTAKIVAARKTITEEAEKIAVIKLQGQEDTSIGQAQERRLQLELQYASQRTHSYQEEIAYRKALGSEENKILQAKVDETTLALILATANGNEEKTEEAKVAAMKAQIALRNQQLQLEVQIQAILVQHDKTLREGLTDFIKTADAQMKEPGDILKEGLTSALDQTSENLTRLMTGQKTKWADEFKAIGREMLKESIKSELTQVLHKLHPGSKPPQHPIDLWAQNPHVRVDNPCDGQQGQNQNVDQNGLPVSPIASFPPSLTNLPNWSKPASWLGNAFNILGGAGGGGAGGAADAGESVTSSIAFPEAGGGDIDPGRIYKVAEAGEGEFITPKNNSTVTPLSKMPGGGGSPHITYQIDNRGAELGSENRLHAVLRSVHASAASSAMKATKEQTRRTPKRA